MRKRYGALEIIAWIIKLIGWVIIVIACLSFAYFMFTYSSQQPVASPYGVVTPLAIVFVSIFISLSTLLSGILFLAAGLLIDAVVDIALNTAELATVANNSERTVEFFEHMSNRANGGARRSDGTVQSPRGV